MMQSYPLSIRQLKATESRLQAIFDAAKLGLQGESLALAAGMLPVEYRQLCQLDPVAEYAEQSGRAKGELEMAQVLHIAAMAGDAKSALEVLKHKHGWVAKQQMQIDVSQQISILTALDLAEQRLTIDATDAIFSPRRDDAHVPSLGASTQG